MFNEMFNEMFNTCVFVLMTNLLIVAIMLIIFVPYQFFVGKMFNNNVSLMIFYLIMAILFIICYFSLRFYDIGFDFYYFAFLYIVIFFNPTDKLVTFVQQFLYGKKPKE